MDIRRFNELAGVKNRTDYLKEYYNVDNGMPLQRLDELTLNRVLKKHGADGYIVVSANRADEEPQVNNKNTKELASFLCQSNYSFAPVYGGYHGTDDMVDEFEPSFIIFNHDKKGNLLDFTDLKLLAIKLCEKYRQDSVLIKEPDKAPYYINKEGDIVGNAVNDNPALNDPSREYYTSLIKSNNLDYNNPDRLKRFSYDMVFGNPNPATINELRRRADGFGEVIFKFGKHDFLG